MFPCLSVFLVYIVSPTVRHQDIAVLAINSVLTSLLSAFTHTQNACMVTDVKKISNTFDQEAINIIYFTDFSGGIALKLEKVGPTLF